MPKERNMFKLKDILFAQFGEKVIINIDESENYPFVEVDSKNLLEVCSFLFKDDRCYFDYLSCLTGCDLLSENKIELIYDLVSIGLEQKITLKVILNRDSSEVPSISSIWRTADWHEREIFDLLGVDFINHPDLRRILLPTNWEGYPLRKDYKDAERYHGVKIAY